MNVDMFIALTLLLIAIVLGSTCRAAIGTAPR